jgi:hypothetical protein
MKSVSSQICEEFLKHPTINPITGRRIEKGKVTYNKLMKECEQKSPSLHSFQFIMLHFVRKCNAKI